MRKYEPIWNILKTDFTVSISAPANTHPRIINAVRKEKARDVVWKLLQSEAGSRFRLKDQAEGDTLTFTLIVDTSSYISDMRL